MMQVRNCDDLQIAYVILRELRRMGQEATEKADELKRNIRAFTHRPGPDVDWHIISDEGMDGYISLERLPDRLDAMSEETVKEWFEHNRYMVCRPSMYDCTGQQFTVWYKLFRRRGHWFAYHSVALDV